MLKDFKTRVESSPGVELRRFGGAFLSDGFSVFLLVVRGALG